MNEAEAYAMLTKAGIQFQKGNIIVPENFQSSEELEDAIDYLCDNWDYQCDYDRP